VRLKRWEKLDEKEVEELMKSGWKVLKLVEDDGLYMRWERTNVPTSGKVYEIDYQQKKIYVVPEGPWSRAY